VITSAEPFEATLSNLLVTCIVRFEWFCLR
jgi:hypothetical protein